MSYLKPVYAIASNTFRETVRDRVLYAFVVFAFAITLTGSLLGSLSVGQDLRVLEDLGLATIAFIGGIISIFVGTSLVYKEVERRTIYLLVTKPVSRWQFVLGKYLGLSVCVGVVTLAMGLFLLCVLGFFAPVDKVAPLMGEALFTIYLELLFITALATFFSTFATPIMSVIFTLALWFIGHMGQSLRDLGKISESPGLAKLFELIYWLLPDLARLTQVRGELMYGRQPEQELMIYLAAYILAFVVLLLSLSTAVTERREFP